MFTSIGNTLCCQTTQGDVSCVVSAPPLWCLSAKEQHLSSADLFARLLHIVATTFQQYSRYRLRHRWSIAQRHVNMEQALQIRLDRADKEKRLTALSAPVSIFLFPGKQLIPQATEALQRISAGKASTADSPALCTCICCSCSNALLCAVCMLASASPIPYIFLTNGGGMTEAAKAAQLSGWFNLEIPNDIVCLSHSPMKQLLDKYRHKPILVLGMTDVKAVALHYGFKHVLTMAELAARFPALTPHLHRVEPGGGEAQHTHVQHEPEEHPSPEQVHRGLASITAIFVMHDPNQWYRDIQICLDVLTANDTQHKHHPTPLYFSNSDLLFSGLHSTPRLAQGAFRVALQSLYEQLTGQQLPVTLFGKPEAVTFSYAEKLLQERAKRLGYDQIHRYYMIGDNPAADIRGANRAGPHWTSILVQSGTIPVRHDNTH